MKTKLIAWYLPQYHSIPENDMFWGKGFTDWVPVRNAKPLHKGHQQPKIPLNNNYYDLSIKDNIMWQAKLAKEHGIYGFGIYHYWFNNEKNLLTKPLDILYKNKDIDINFLLTWDNASWIRSWSAISGNAWAPIADKCNDCNQGEGTLIPYILGKESDWINHFNHIIHYFKDKRYIKIGNKPVFIILQYDEQINRMCNCWDSLSKEEGFDGIFFIYKNKRWYNWQENLYRFNYEPHFNGWENPSTWERKKEKLQKILNINKGPLYYNYNTIWKKILDNSKLSPSNVFLGAFISYDDSPRRSSKGRIVRKSSPKLFKKYLSKLIEISEKQGKEYIFITAWNEWGEGAFLEPDETYKYEYLNVIKNIINDK